jgi:hypothetical protein
MLAASRGHAVTVDAILAAWGAKGAGKASGGDSARDRQWALLSAQNEKQLTAVHCAARVGHTQVVLLLTNKYVVMFLFPASSAFRLRLAHLRLVSAS